MGTTTTGDPLAIVPEAHRADARAALAGVLGDDALAGLRPVAGGASGALAYRADSERRGRYLLRIETARDPFRDPRRTYPCMRAAAEAGIAPALHHADADAGVVVMDLLDERPIEGHPGGPPGLVGELAGLLARLQATPVFPPLLEDFGALLDRMLALVRGAGVFAPGTLDPHAEGLARIRAAYPWGREPQASSHNDVNPRNVLFDGERLWLVDWETAFRNDPLADVAIVANMFCAPDGVDDPGLLDVLLAGWLGRPPDDGTRARLALMRQLSRLFYGCLIASMFVGRPEGRALAAPTPGRFRAAVEAGEMPVTSPETLFTLAAMNLVAFADGLAAPSFPRDLHVAAEA